MIGRAVNFARRLLPDALSLHPAWVTTETGVKVCLDSRLTLDMFAELFVTQPYALALDLAPRVDFVVDLGANRGLFVLFAEHHLRKQRLGVSPEFLCVEPVADNVRRLRRNVEANGLGARVTVVRGAVSGLRSGTAAFYYAPQAHGMGALVPRRRLTTRQVQVIDLEEYVQGRSIDVLKIDIEGAEDRFLDGYGAVLERTGVFVGEFHLRAIDYPRCRSLLEKAGLEWTRRTFQFRDVLCVEVYARRSGAT